MMTDERKDKDVTAETVTGPPDGDEDVPLIRCVCGRAFDDWEFILSVYPDLAKPCPACGRRLYVAVEVCVFEVTP